MIKLQKAGGSWQRMLDEWQHQCEQYGELLDNYAVATLPVLRALAETPEKSAGVYGVEREGHIGAICQLNRTPLPGYDSPVLRVRLLTVSPKYDFGEISLDEYGELLVGAIFGAIKLSSEAEMESQFINFHLRSPSDRPFFRALGTGLDQTSVFKEVKMAGSWLYITKK